MTQAEQLAALKDQQEQQQELQRSRGYPGTPAWSKGDQVGCTGWDWLVDWLVDCLFVSSAAGACVVCVCVCVCVLTCGCGGRQTLHVIVIVVPDQPFPFPTARTNDPRQDRYTSSLRALHVECREVVDAVLQGELSQDVLGDDDNLAAGGGM